MNFKIALILFVFLMTQAAFSGEGEATLSYTTNLKITSQKSFKLKVKEAFVNGQL